MSPKLLAKMAAYVDRFSVMTYDFSVQLGRRTWRRLLCLCRGAAPTHSLAPCLAWALCMHGTAGPNAPLPWLESTLEILSGGDAALKKKILLGIPFYGYAGLVWRGPCVHRALIVSAPCSYDNMDAVVGHTYIDLLEQYQPEIGYDEDSAEHYFRYTPEGGQTHVVFYPTLQSTSERLDLATRAGAAGVAIWEIGQGLDYFYDLL